MERSTQKEIEKGDQSGFTHSKRLEGGERGERHFSRKWIGRTSMSKYTETFHITVSGKGKVTKQN